VRQSPTAGNGPLLAPLGQAFRRLQWAVGKRLSVRAKLTIWYAAMCALTLALVGFGMRQALDYRTASSIDPNLTVSANRVLAALQNSSYNGQVAKTAMLQVGNSPDVRLCARAIRPYCAWLKLKLYDYSGTYDSPGVTEQVQIIAVGNPTGTQGYTLPLLVPGSRQPVHFFQGNNPVGMIQLVANMASERFVTVHDRGETFRVYIQTLPTPATLKNRPTALLEVLQNEHAYLQIQRDLNVILLIGLPLGLIIALIAGWWIARAALRPIDRISRTVRSVGESQDLSRRVDFIGPEDEVGRLAATFDRMLARLEKSFDTQKRFIADASHELRTPLTAIKGNADLMTIAPAEEKDICLTAIRREAERMSRLVSDLLLLAEADVAEQPVHMQPVNLASVVDDVYASTLLMAGDGVEVMLERNDPVLVLADADRVKQLILNLADNAVKFTPAGGAVSLSLKAEPEGARIEVSDSGVGISREDQEAIFERFYRAESSRTKRGSGLGLSICSWIVEAHGGSISVRSEPGKGSTFTVTLPNRIPDEDASVTPSQAMVLGV
jgi:signal transduction histidine kinase